MPTLTEAERLNLALEKLKFGDFQERWDIVKVLPEFGAQILPSLLQIWQEPRLETEARWFSGRLLAQYPQPEVILALAQLLKEDAPRELRAVAAEGLASMGESAIYPLVDLLENSDTRYLAVQALAQMRRSGVIEPLLKIVGDGDGLLRAIALEALGSFRDERIFPVLVRALGDREEKVQQEALQALGYWGEAATSQVERIATLLSASSSSLAQQAALTLGRIATPEAAKALYQVLKLAPIPLERQKHLVKALGWMEIPLALDYLAESLAVAPPLLCQEIITLLGRQTQEEGKKHAAQILVDWLERGGTVLENAPIRQFLATALGELGQVETVEVLRCLSTDEDTYVRLHAQAALKKFS
jgi:HEAT repeat protein